MKPEAGSRKAGTHTGAAKLAFRFATLDDVALLARLNRQLIQDERSQTQLSLRGLEERMRGWLRGEYRAVLFMLGSKPVAYALYRRDPQVFYLRQFFVGRSQRRRGIGREAIEMFLDQVLPSGDDVALEVLTHNKGALKFWRSVGFRDHAISMELRRQPGRRTGAPQAFIALGSNLGDSRRILETAIARLKELSTKPLLTSSCWLTTPVDCPTGSPLFVNAVIGLVPRADETPESLLKKLQMLEREFGRGRKKILNEARPLDLDLFAFGSETRTTGRLILPHPRAHRRRFVLEPLSEIAPDLVLPGQSRTVAELVRNLPAGEMVSRL